MRVPMSGLPAQFEALRAEVMPEVTALLAEQSFILGEPVLAFERTLAGICGTAHAVGVASGTDALVLALRAVGVGPGDRVVVPAFGFLACAGAVVQAGAVPVFADTCGFLLDPEGVEEALARPGSEWVKAVLAVHLFGACAPMEELLTLAASRGLAVVEDAAQAIAATSAGRPAGSMGAAGALSFFPSKNLGAWGDGGAVVCSDDAIAARVRRLRAHGVEEGQAVEAGTNSRLDALQAVVLSVKARHLEAWTRAREARAAAYRAALAPLEGRVRLPDPPRPGHRHIHNQFVIRVDDPDRLAAFLAERGVASRRYYPRALPDEPAFARFAEGRAFPGAREAARTALGLPIYPELSQEQQEHVVAALKDHFR